MRSAVIEERFWKRVDRSGKCWLWMKHRNEDGYGTLRWNGKMEKAHRVAWILKHGPIPEGKQVLHRCDNPPCVRHLFLGTNHDNVLDRHAKGRSKNLFASINHPATSRRGEKHWCAKLSASQVSNIRLLNSRGVSQIELGRIFHVHGATISRIVRREWRQEVA